MIVSDDVVRIVAITAWAVVVWRGLHARALDALWWACVLLAVVVTLTIRSNSGWLADVTGIPGLARLASSLAAVGCAAAIVLWQARSARLAEQAPVGTNVLLAGWGATVLGLVGTWLSAPHGTGAAPSTHPAVAVHELLLHGFLLATALTTSTAVLRELRNQPFGMVRTGLLVLVAAAACLFAGTTLQVGSQVAALAGVPLDDPVPTSAAALVGAFTVLFLVGVSVPLLGSGTRRAKAVHTDVEELWRWLVGSEDEPAPDELFTMLVDIRDQIWVLQQRVERVQLVAASRYARRLGLLGSAGRAFTLAVCLELATAADRRGDERSGEPADLSRLGGGRLPEQEARWLAEVAAARRTRGTAAAAAKIFSRSPAAGATG